MREQELARAELLDEIALRIELHHGIERTAGAIVGTAIANSPPPGYYYPPPPPGAYYPPPPPGYGPPPPGAYYPPPPGAAPGPAYAQLAPGCHWGKRKVWVEGAGYQWQPVQVCP